MIAKVVFDNKEHNIDKFFDYKIPETLSEDIKIGVRVRVPLGRGNHFAYGIVVGITDTSELTELKEIVSYVDKTPVCSEKMIDLCMWIKENCFCSFYQALRLVAPPGMSRGIKEKKARYARLLISGAELDEAVLRLKKRNARSMLAVIEYLKDKELAEVLKIYESTGASSSTLKALSEKGITEVFEKNIERKVFLSESIPASKKYVPTEEQKKVIDYLNMCITEEKHDKVLLRGVTGSGKTEVFLQAIETVLKKGKAAIMLVPEISLTPQMVNRFVSRFGEYVAVIHSGLSYGERFDQWQKIRSGKVSVVVGARSAVFAPFENLGIIILDEEHENSYKSDSSPKYHTVDVAKKRAEDDGAVLLLASATPSVSDYYYAEKGEYTLFEMYKRYNEMKLPEVKIVDMRAELFENKNRSPISLYLQKEIQKNIETGSKTILFLNRRGYSTFVSCRECGYVVECPECSIALTYHKREDKLVCHYCGHTVENISKCPECGSKYVRYFGTGTQKIEEELKNLFPAANIMRMDFDTTAQKGGHEKILNKFAESGDILLGTQMVTKGLDFHDVTLVGVLAADTTLCMDDYRAPERSFSLFTQVCGRAGRGDVPGRAVIQTYQPFNATIKYAASQNYELFYENEINSRKRLNYPPFCKIVCIMITSDDEKKGLEAINSVGKMIAAFAAGYGGRLDMLEPQPAPISKIKNKYRFRIVVKADKTEELKTVLEKAEELYSNGKKGIFLSIDINPVNMY